MTVDELRKLLATTNLSQRSLAKETGINERKMRYVFAGKEKLTLTEELACKYILGVTYQVTDR